MTHRYGLQNEQWERIKELLPGREGTVGVTAQDNRRFVEAVFYRYRSGIPWRDLPERFGDYRVVHTRFTGGWEKVFKELSEDADNEYAMIDSTLVRAHQHSVGAKESRAEQEDIDRSAGSLNIQIHTVSSLGSGVVPSSSSH